MQIGNIVSRVKNAQEISEEESVFLVESYIAETMGLAVKILAPENHGPENPNASLNYLSRLTRATDNAIQYFWNKW